MGRTNYSRGYLYNLYGQKPFNRFDVPELSRSNILNVFPGGGRDGNKFTYSIDSIVCDQYNMVGEELTSLSFSHSSLQTDIDGDGIDNALDPDIDGDGIDNALDPDIDGDGIDNALDPSIAPQNYYTNYYQGDKTQLDMSIDMDSETATFLGGSLTTTGHHWYLYIPDDINIIKMNNPNWTWNLTKNIWFDVGENLELLQTGIKPRRLLWDVGDTLSFYWSEGGAQTSSLFLLTITDDPTLAPP